ncbi:ATP-binding protein [Pedobacter psychrodurus]|uniref:ATP-binding protein n=1 Tax=Pedobacter psychrodurus TaxID=2530456 RepID=UPI003977DECD
MLRFIRFFHFTAILFKQKIIGRNKIIITSQLPLDKYYEFINEPSLVDAVLDRLTASANKVELVGESLRKKK